MSRVWEIGVAWMVQYSIHSTLLLGITWAVTIFPVLRSYRLHDLLWKFALVMSPISATIITIKALPYIALSHDFLFIFWTVGAVFSALWFGVMSIRLGTFLHSAYPADEELQELLDSLCLEANVQCKVQLLVSPTLYSPVALPHHRICVPEYTVYSLPIPHQRAMLAHELAHILRGDSRWLRLARLLRNVFFLQPLNAVAYRHLEETAEYLADGWVVRQTGKPLILAECIATVAAGMLHQSPVTPGLVAAQSSLVRRVRYLVEHVEYPPLKRRYIVCVCGLVALLFVSLLLVINANEGCPVGLAYEVLALVWIVIGGAFCFQRLTRISV